MSYDRVVPVFAAAFAVMYVCAVEANWALVTYHPRINEWDLGTKLSRSGPAMHWFGWLGTALVGATGISLAALPLSRWWTPPVWIGWAVPLAIMLLFVYLLRSFFLR